MATCQPSHLHVSSTSTIRRRSTGRGNLMHLPGFLVSSACCPGPVRLLGAPSSSMGREECGVTTADCTENSSTLTNALPSGARDAATTSRIRLSWIGTTKPITEPVQLPRAALSVPVTEKNTESGENGRCCTPMKDAHRIVSNLHAATATSFFGVYDDHGGPAVSDYHAKHLHIELRKHTNVCDNPQIAIEQTFLRMDEMMRDRKAGKELSEYGGSEYWEEHQPLIRRRRFLPICGEKPDYRGPLYDGCTACVVLIECTVGDAGDCRCVLSRNDQNVPPALLVRFLREHRSEWADPGIDACSPTALRASPYAVPGLRASGFMGSQVILPLALTSEREECLEDIRREGHNLCHDKVVLSRDMYVLQFCSGVDENAAGACAQLVFAPIDESLADDAPLLPSGFRVVPLDAKTAFPEVRFENINHDAQFLIIACDGIWDCMTSQQAVNFVRMYPAANAGLAFMCESLLSHCLATPSGRDNMTVMLVRFKTPGAAQAQPVL